jgi:hypothetical protein
MGNDSRLTLRKCQDETVYCCCISTNGKWLQMDLEECQNGRDCCHGVHLSMNGNDSRLTLRKCQDEFSCHGISVSLELMGSDSRLTVRYVKMRTFAAAAYISVCVLLGNHFRLTLRNVKMRGFAVVASVLLMGNDLLLLHLCKWLQIDLEECKGEKVCRCCEDRLKWLSIYLDEMSGISFTVVSFVSTGNKNVTLSIQWKKYQIDLKES